MEGKIGRWQDWVQIAAIIGVGITIWLNVPTKGDISALRDELKGDIKALRDEIKGDIKALRDEIKSDVMKVATKEEMKKEFDDVIATISTLRREVDDVKTDVRANNQNHVNHLAKHEQ